MQWRLNLYCKLVNQIPGIREKYLHFRNGQSRYPRWLAYLYLLFLNFQYYVLRKKSLTNLSDYNHDKKIILSQDPESSLSKIIEPEVYIKKFSNADVVSFDVFDTLILRQFKDPKDVFYILQDELKYIDFKSIRIRAEETVRHRSLERYGHGEINLFEIWTEIEKLCGVDKKKGIAIEMEAELRTCYANPFFLEVVKLLRMQNKTIIVTSDTYFEDEFIRKILLKCGYTEFDYYFCSCNLKKSKNKGDIYKYIKGLIGNDLNYVHVGDNYYSDFLKAREQGICAISYKNINSIGKRYRPFDMSPVVGSVYSGIVNGRIHNGLEVYTKEYELGFIYGGLFITGYCQYIYSYVRKNNIDKILFLARDGDIICKVYKLMYPEQKEKCEYVYWSRLASVKLCASYFKTFFFDRMIVCKVNQGYKVKDIFNTMNLKDMLNLFLNESKYNEDSLLDSKMLKKLMEFLEDNWNIVCEHYEESQNEAQKYYKKVIGDGKKIVAIDVGWMGSGALLLKYLIENVWKFDCSLTGIVAGTVTDDADYEATALQYSDETLSSYLFSATTNRDLWKVHNADKGHNLIVELILSSNQSAFLGFERDVEGNYMFNSDTEKINSKEVQRGIMDFVSSYMNHPLKKLIISGRDAAAPFTVLYNNDVWVKQLIKQSNIKANIE